MMSPAWPAPTTAVSIDPGSSIGTPPSVDAGRDEYAKKPFGCDTVAIRHPSFDPP